MTEASSSGAVTDAGPNNSYGLKFHHLGLAVSEPNSAELFLRGLGYEIGAFVLDPLQSVHLAICEHVSMPAVEIIYPATGAGPLDNLLAQHKDGLVYHVCYTADDVEEAIDAIEASGSRVFCVSPPQPAVLFGGKHVSFYVVEGIGLIEIIDLS